MHYDRSAFGVRKTRTVSYGIHFDTTQKCEAKVALSAVDEYCVYCLFQVNWLHSLAFKLKQVGKISNNLKYVRNFYSFCFCFSHSSLMFNYVFEWIVFPIMNFISPKWISCFMLSRSFFLCLHVSSWRTHFDFSWRKHSCSVCFLILCLVLKHIAIVYLLLLFHPEMLFQFVFLRFFSRCVLWFIFSFWPCEDAQKPRKNNDEIHVYILLWVVLDALRRCYSFYLCFLTTWTIPFCKNLWPERNEKMKIYETRKKRKKNLNLFTFTKTIQTFSSLYDVLCVFWWLQTKSEFYIFFSSNFIVVSVVILRIVWFALHWQLFFVSLLLFSVLSRILQKIGFFVCSPNCWLFSRLRLTALTRRSTDLTDNFLSFLFFVFKGDFSFSRHKFMQHV